MQKVLPIVIMMFFIAYGCKKDDKIAEQAAAVDWNEQFVGTYTGIMAYRNFNMSSPAEPWTLKDSFIIIGKYAPDPNYNTTSLQNVPQIRFTDPSGFPGSPSGPLKIFKFTGDSLYYHGKTASGAGLEIEFHGKKTP